MHEVSSRVMAGGNATTSVNPRDASEKHWAEFMCVVDEVGDGILEAGL
jgi:hypothetical protein